VLHKDTKTPKECGVEGFALSLLEMDARIRTYHIYQDTGDIKGYCPTKKFLYFPVGLPTAEHEIAHMVEIQNTARLTRQDWGMTNTPLEQKSSRQLFAALVREIKVRTIQLRMTPGSKTCEDIFNNSYWKDEARKRVPFGRFKSWENVTDWAESLRVKTYRAWSLDRIRHEWEIRLNHIRDWMETPALNSPIR
jgi:hypothetical protein